MEALELEDEGLWEPLEPVKPPPFLLPEEFELGGRVQRTGLVEGLDCLDCNSSCKCVRKGQGELTFDFFAGISSLRGAGVRSVG